MGDPADRPWDHDGLNTCSYCGQAYRWECVCWPINGRSKEAKQNREALAAYEEEAANG